MSTEVNAIVNAHGAPKEEQRDRRTKTGERRGRSALLTVPIVIVGTLAISLNLAAPAHAVVAKKPLNPKLIENPVRVATVIAAAVEAPPAQYSVVEGDTVSGIATRFGLSTPTVLSLNGLDSSALIFPGQVLMLSGGAATASATPAAQNVQDAQSYTVLSGDTIGAIAGAHGLSTDAVLRANGLDRSSIIYPGQTILVTVDPVAQIVPAAFITALGPVTAPLAAGTQHTIQTGDTISAVAATAGVSVQAVLDANGLGWSSMIYPGQVLAIPSPASAVPDATHVTPLTDEMRANAQTIVAVGRSIGVSDYGLVVALAAAAQESGLRNVDYGDRDSLGLFQQRPSAGWGTPDQVMDPTRATLAFFGGSSNPNTGVTRGLLEIGNWESLTVTEAAQSVQISAFPDHYAKWETSARAWLTQLG
ncbi:LysM peptidoglycan-binding domain-containing protein [Cryobacterium sp. CG_9.6]|uniref:LysM peptidoglycan-binding domain-containing protein n=1 Tax=Cryobacterium sp. CG_9.6 TaxID=2760710 RepID=UPI002472E889|nr:LysM peptidoglycan-binding domain-containing protein [Cryobacterium sp. CG_9.6]MDH6237234.1 LysM repeat protein [Cryobacterium sp. CG_9.6]